MGGARGEAGKRDVSRPPDIFLQSFCDAVSRFLGEYFSRDPRDLCFRDRRDNHFLN